MYTVCTRVYMYICIDDELKANIRRLKIIAMAQNGNLVKPNKLHYYRKGFGTHGMKCILYVIGRGKINVIFSIAHTFFFARSLLHYNTRTHMCIQSHIVFRYEVWRFGP